MGTPTAGGVRKERCGGIPGTAVRDGGDAARPPPVRSVTLVKLPPVLRARFAVSPERTGVEEGNEPFLGGTPHPTPPPAPVPECGARQVRGNRPAGTGCWQAAGEKKMPLAQRALLRGRCRCKMPRDGRDRGRCPPKGSNTYLTVGHI